MKQHQAIKQSLLSQRDQLHTEQAKTNYLNNLPLIDGSSIFQRFFFTWLHPFLNYSSKQGVTVQSMPSLPNKFTTAIQHERLMKIWESIPEGSAQGWRLIKTIFFGYRGQLIGLLIFLVFCVGFYLTQPIMTSYNIDYIQNHQGDLSYGLTLFFLSFFFQVVNKLCFAQYLYRFSFIGVKWSNALNTMIYFKSLKYSTLANKKFSEAEIINYSQTDAERMTYAGYQLSSIIYGPIQIIFGLIMMYFYVGISFLVGVSTIVALLIANYFISKKVNQYNQKALKAKDARMKVTQEMLDIIRFIKISAIEKFFFNKLQSKRISQLSLYLKKGLLYSITIFLFWISSPLLLSLTFIVYVALGNELTSQVAFTVIMLGNIIQYPIYSLPTAISQLIQMMVSLRRIQKFLLADDIKSDLITIEKDSNYAVRIQNGNFFWQKQQKQQKSQQEKQREEKEKNSNKQKKELEQVSEQKLEQKQKDKLNFELIHVLKDLNLSIKKGKFVMVVGDIGSGKSSLLLAILNEMINHEGSKVFLSGSIAYSAQKPWIMSKTVKQNITFNLSYDEQKFKRVIYHSSFEHDLSILPQGQQTQIGEKGINISGGQKARLSLARALYSQNDIYLLDDILSAVDVHVGDFLIKQTLKGFLKGKTIIMPTHALRYIQQADQIIVMNKGQIVQKGSYNQICSTPQFQQICSHEAQHQKQGKKQQTQQQAIDAQLAMIAEVMKNKTQSKQVQKQIANINQLIIEQLILPQDQEKGQVNFKIFKQFIENAGGYYKFVIPVMASMILWITCKTLASVFIEKNCQNPTQNNKQLYLYVAFVMLSNVFILIRATVMVFSSNSQGKKVHDKLMKSLLYASLSNFFNRVPIGRIVNRLTKDLRQIDEDIVDAIAWLIISFFELLSTLVICVYASSALAVIPMIIVGILSHQVRKYYMKTQREVSRYEKSTNSPVVSGFMSTISGLSSIRAYKIENTFLQTQMQNIDVNKRVRLSRSGLQNWFSNILLFLSFLVNMPCIAYCMFSTNTNPSLIGLLMVYALGLCQGMSHMTLSFAFFQTKLVSMERIYTFIRIEPEQGYKQYCSQWASQEQGGKQVFSEGAVEFQNVSARYRQGLPNILKDISCTIQAGQKIGIVGRTGAGKSTIINTFLKMTQISSGRLKIDGRDMGQYSLKDLRYSITMIDQQPTLIKSTFRQNLDITGKYSDQQLEDILKQCNLYDIIKQKGGLDANVSNLSLSVGEKQLLCICRAFLKNSRIVLIDEATANIDVKNDTLIQKVIAEKFKNSTVLTIAHRLSTIQNSDKIMVLQKGRLIQFGRPGDLQRKIGGFYAEMLKKNAVQMLS